MVTLGLIASLLLRLMPYGGFSYLSLCPLSSGRYCGLIFAFSLRLVSPFKKFLNQNAVNQQ